MVDFHKKFNVNNIDIVLNILLIKLPTFFMRKFLIDNYNMLIGEEVSVFITLFR
jgi:hypothetical protein